MAIFYILLLVLIGIIILDLWNWSVGDCKCGGKYYYDFYDGEIDKNVYKCNQCGNEVI